MEAATAHSTDSLLTRDGAVLAAPVAPVVGSRQPIDGVTQCVCCSRFPLVGELVTRHRDGEGGWACSSCERAGRADRLGPPSGSDRVRTLGGAMNVRRAI
ncbi:MAG: hypothetical protein ACR2K6_04845 [Solirubrobacterales bacterium]